MPSWTFAGHLHGVTPRLVVEIVSGKSEGETNSISKINNGGSARKTQSGAEEREGKRQIVGYPNVVAPRKIQTTDGH